MAFYNPLAPDRLIFIVATEEEGAAADRWLGRARHHLSGSNGFSRVDAPDLVVQQLASASDPEETGPERRRMQFTHGWKWRHVDGADRKVRPNLNGRLTARKVELELMRKANGAHFALAGGATDDRKMFDGDWFTLADAATDRSPIRSMVAGTTGAELIAIHERWGVEGEITFVPDYSPGDIDPLKAYTITMEPGETWMFTQRQKTMVDPVLGASVQRKVLWAEIFEK